MLGRRAAGAQCPLGWRPSKRDADANSSSYARDWSGQRSHFPLREVEMVGPLQWQLFSQVDTCWALFPGPAKRLWEALDHTVLSRPSPGGECRARGGYAAAGAGCDKHLRVATKGGASNNCRRLDIVWGADQRNRVRGSGSRQALQDIMRRSQRPTRGSDRHQRLAWRSTRAFIPFQDPRFLSTDAELRLQSHRPLESPSWARDPNMSWCHCQSSKVR